MNSKKPFYHGISSVLLTGFALFFLSACRTESADRTNHQPGGGSSSAVAEETEPAPSKASGSRQAAPEIKGLLLGTDKTVSSSTDYRGKFLIVNFWATWCGPCVAELPALERMYQVLKTKYPNGEFELIGVNADIDSSLDSVKEMVRTRGMTFPVILDPEGAIVKAFNLTGFPETIFIDPAGNRVQVIDPDNKVQGDRLLSDRPWDTPQYLELVQNLIQAQAKPN